MSVILTAMDQDNDTLIYTLESQPTNGNITGDAPNLTYVPNANYSGTDSFTYKVNDGSTDSNVGIVSIVINNINSIPVADSFSRSVNEDESVVIALTGTDSDGDTLSYQIINQPSEGILSENVPNLIYTPRTNYNGTDSFTFKVNDGVVDSNIAVVNLSIIAINDVPIANPSSLLIDEDTNSSFILTASDFDNDNLLYQIVSQPTQGVLTGDLPNLTYAPNANYFGQDSFSFSVNDGSVDSAIVTMQINVTGINDAPIAANITAEVFENDSVTFQLIGTDIDNDALTYTVVSQAVNGVISGDIPNIIYTPNNNFNGDDSFVYSVNDSAVDSVNATVAINVIAVNDAPIGVIQNIEINEDTISSIVLSATDTDEDVLIYRVLTRPSQGSLTGVAPNVSYLPNENYTGVDSFTFVANDGQLDSINTTINITILPVNDSPIAQSQLLLLNEDSLLEIVLSANDADDDNLTFNIISQPLYGELSGLIPNVIYTPNTNFNGSDSFEFSANDGEFDSIPAIINLTVQAINDRPIAYEQFISLNEDAAIAITLNGLDADGDNLSYQITQPPTYGVMTGAEPDLIYTPNENFNGIDELYFTVSDGQTTSVATLVDINVLAVNDVPVILNEPITLQEDSVLNYVVQVVDVDNDSLSYTLSGFPQNGVAQLNGNALVYTPTGNFSGTDLIEISVSDGTVSSSAQFSITVINVNDAPLINSQPDLIAGVGELYEYALIVSDADGDAISYSFMISPDGMQIDSTFGLISWTPESQQVGNHEIEVSVTDSVGAMINQQWTLTVVEPNSIPVITSSPVTQATTGSEYIYDVEATDVNTQDILSYVLNSQPDGMQINDTTGLINWNVSQTWQGNTAGNNNFCYATSESIGESTDIGLDMVFLIDVTGSMFNTNSSGVRTGVYEWLREAIPQVEANLQSKNIGVGTLSNRYGLNAYAGVVASPTIRNGDNYFADWRVFYQSIDDLPPGNSSPERAHRAIVYVLDNYRFLEGNSKDILIYSDEDRYSNGFDAEYEATYNRVTEAGVTIHAIVPQIFTCEDEVGNTLSAFGMDASGIGYIADGIGGFTTCTNAIAVGADNRGAYPFLALNSGGSAWNFDEVNASQEVKDAFTAALFAIKYKDIQRQVQSVELADLNVKSIEIIDEVATVVIENRGLTDYSFSFNVQLLGDGVIIHDELVSGLNLDQMLSVSAAIDPNAYATLAAKIVTTEQNSECSINNNELHQPLVSVVVSDNNGASATQNYTIQINVVNKVPEFTSQPNTTALVGLEYRYTPVVSDTNQGDALRFNLNSAPTGMTIDNYSGVIYFNANSNQTGLHSVVIQVIDLVGAVSEQSYVLEVTNDYIKPRITSTPEPRAIEGSVYQYMLTVDSDSTALLTFEIFGGPAGLTIEASTGLAEWQVPIGFAGSVEPLVIKVIDQFGNFDIQSVSLFGDIPNVAPYF